MEVVRYGDKCILIQENTGKKVEAEVFEFKEKSKLTVVVNKNVKVPLVWNGQCYEGKMAGMDFISSGPDVRKSKIGRG